MYNKEIIGMSNLPELKKFVILLECGHSKVCDHTVESVYNYNQGDKLECFMCINGEEPEGID
jgi:hypothetical protein